MIGVIHRVKNSVLQKCSNLNESIISNDIPKLVDACIYRFAEDIISLINDTYLDINEEALRIKVSSILKKNILKKIKRKIFIDSLALQITNDSYIQDYFDNKISYNEILEKYVTEFNNNKNTNQLNMSEDLNLSELFKDLVIYIDSEIKFKLNENVFLVQKIDEYVVNFQNEIQRKIVEVFDDLDYKYLDILKQELEIKIDDNKEKKEEVNMFDTSKIVKSDENLNKFDKYDDVTLFNKTILTLNTKEEKLTRLENKLADRRKKVDERLFQTNKDIEDNIERENKLSQRKLELNERQNDLNAKSSETEMILLNMKPLISGLSKIKDFNLSGGSKDE